MKSDGRDIREFFYPEYVCVIFLAIFLSVTMHARSFLVEHNEGDERVYLCLAREMNWDLTHYTTRNNADVGKFPNSIYRGPLFHHPPLFPLILKFGQELFHDPVMVGLIVENLALWLLLYYAWRWMVFQQLPIGWGVICIVGITFCPLLLSSSTLLHHDCLMSCLMTAGLVAYIEALQRPTLPRALIAAGLLCSGLNVRYNALIFIPIIVVLQLDNLWRTEPAIAAGRKSSAKAVEPRSDRWFTFGIVFILIVTVGLQHYYRMLWAYGTLLPSGFLHADPDAAAFSGYMQYVARQTRWKTVAHLVLIYPVLLSFLLPAVWFALRRGLRERSREAYFGYIFLYLFVFELCFSYSQVRYFATVTPSLFLGLPYIIHQQSLRYRWILCGLAAVTLMEMTTTGFLKTQVQPPDSMMIMPSAFFYFPPLRALCF